MNNFFNLTIAIFLLTLGVTQLSATYNQLRAASWVGASRLLGYGLAGGLMVAGAIILSRQLPVAWWMVLGVTVLLGPVSLGLSLLAGSLIAPPSHPDRLFEASRPAQLKQALIEVERLRLAGEAVKLSVTVPQCFHPTSATGCGAGEAFFTIDPWGNVKPCNHTPMIFGNLRYDSVAQIQASEQLTYWHNLQPAGCHDCTALAICGGGCRAEAMLNQAPGDTFLILPDYLHPIATYDFASQDFIPDIDCHTREILTTQLDGRLTLKEFGQQYGQAMLNLLAAMHQEGVVEFV